MKKMTRKEKILLGVSIVGVCAAGYFGYKYYSYKNDNQLLENALKKADADLSTCYKTESCIRIQCTNFDGSGK